MQVLLPHELLQDVRCYLSEGKADNLVAHASAADREDIRRARRFTRVRRPLFPRYLFARPDIGRDRWLSISSTVGLSRLFTREWRPAAIPFGIVETLLAHSDAGLLGEGQRVRILPLADFMATVLRLDERRRVDVLLEIMGLWFPFRSTEAHSAPVM